MKKVNWRYLSIFFAISALLFEWLAGVLLANSISLISEYEGTYEHKAFVESKDTWYYLTHGFGMFSVVASGICALLNKNYKYFPDSALVWFCLMQIFSFSWLAITMFSIEDYSFMTALGSTGFMVWLSTILIFTGIDPRFIKILSRITPALVYITLILFINSALRDHYERIPGASKELRLYLILWWFAAWLYLSSRNTEKSKRMLYELPYLSLVFGALYIQSRSWLLLTIFTFIMRNRFITSKQNKNKTIAMTIVYVFLFILLTGIGTYLVSDTLISAYEGLISRLDEDTRSNQYIYFFESVSVTDLILGLGPAATWYWPGRGDYQFIDNGMLWMLFIGGIPILFGYIATILIPALKCLWSKNTPNNFIASAIILSLYLFMLMGLATYTSPSVSIQSYFAYLIAGQCYWGLYINQNRKTISRTNR